MVFCGNGALRAQLVRSATGLPNVRFLDLQPEARLPELLATADIHVIPQQAQVADFMLPSKLAPILSSARPVVVMAAAGTQLAREVEGAGIAVSPSDDSAFVRAIAKLAADENLRKEMAAVGRTLARERWDKNAILKGFEQRLRELCPAQQDGHN